MLHLIQLQHSVYGRHVAIADEEALYQLSTYRSIYDLAMDAADRNASIEALARQDRSLERLSYDTVYRGTPDWRILPSFDHPREPACLLVSGTGLTHLASAANRQAMHEQVGKAELSDSMRMFQWGVEGGKPAPGTIGVQPEWFYKGPGTMLKGYGDPLLAPSYGSDGGEEPEIAGVYLIDQTGTPRRIGFTMANEFADHVMEKKNYLYLAPSKLRTCAIGPELVVGAEFEEVNGTVSVERAGTTVWTRSIKTGEANMSHSLANLEYHHFKYEAHRRPGDAHVHFFGADAFSFGAGVTLQEGDEMVVAWNGFGRPLRNPIRIDRSPEVLIEVVAL